MYFLLNRLIVNLNFSYLLKKAKIRVESKNNTAAETQQYRNINLQNLNNFIKYIAFTYILIALSSYFNEIFIFYENIKYYIYKLIYKYQKSIPTQVKYRLI